MAPMATRGATRNSKIYLGPPGSLVNSCSRDPNHYHYYASSPVLSDELLLAGSRNHRQRLAEGGKCSNEVARRDTHKACLSVRSTILG